MARQAPARLSCETIVRIVHEMMEQLGMERDDEPEEVVTRTSSGAMEFDSAPGLAFTKPLAATINGKPIHSPRWSAILLAVIALVKTKGLESKKLVGELAIPAKIERYEEEGYKYHPDLGISVQGQSASDAWKEVDRLAKKWRIPVTVEFWWRTQRRSTPAGRVCFAREMGSNRASGCGTAHPHGAARRVKLSAVAPTGDRNYRCCP